MAEYSSEHPTDSIHRSALCADEWLRAHAGVSQNTRLHDLLADDDGRTFALRVVDAIIRPESLVTSASAFQRATLNTPRALPWYARGAVRAAGAVATLLPAPVVPLARSAVRSLISDAVVDARPKQLTAALSAITSSGSRAEVALASIAPLGQESAARQRDALEALIGGELVTSVSYRLAHVVYFDDPWSFSQNVQAATEAVAPLYAAAAHSQTRLLLDVSERQELDSAIAVLTAVLERPELFSVDAGIIIPAGLADSLAAVQELSAWAGVRVADGASPLTIRVTDAPASAHEIEQSALNGWPRPAVTGNTDILAAVVRALHELGDGERAGTVRVSVATHDPFVLAYAAVTGNAVAERELVQLGGVSESWREIVQASMRSVVTTVLAADPRDIAAAADPIAERVSAVATAQSALATAATADPKERADQGREVVRRALTEPPLARRGIDRSQTPDWVLTPPVGSPDGVPAADLTMAVMGIAQSVNSGETTPLSAVVDSVLFGGAAYVETAVFSAFETTAPRGGAMGFRNAQVTDPSLPANRAWALKTKELWARKPRKGWQSPADAVVEIRHGEGSWEGYSAAERGAVLEHAAYHIAQSRSALIAAARGVGVSFSDADRDVTTAIDYADYYAATARELDTIAGAVFVPHTVTVVSGDRADLIASTAEAALAVLATGGAVVVTATGDDRRVTAILAKALWAAGVPDDALRIAEGTPGHAAQATTVDALCVSGDVDDATHRAMQHHSTVVHARVRGVNTVIIASSADIDEAAASVAASAFARGGRAFESVSIVILVGSVARSRRLKAALIQATKTHAARVKREASGGPELDLDALWAVSTLENGQSWLVEPERVSESAYTPGIRVGIEAGHRFAQENPAAPVLGVMSAAGMTSAIALANEVSGGAVAGLHTTNPADAAQFVHQMMAGSLFIGRRVIDPVVQRQPSGGWNGSAWGTAAKVGGPNRLVSLGSWRPSGGHSSSGTLHLRGLDSRVTTLIEAAQPALDFDGFEWVRRAALADALAWDREFGTVRDVTRLGIERNLFRYRPTSIAVRATAKTPLSDVVRVVLAAVRSHSTFVLSVAAGLPAGFRHALGDADVTTFVESDAEFVTRVVASGVGRARIVGPDAARVAADVRAQSSVPVALFADPATTAGRIELLAFMREQTISMGGRSVGSFSAVI